MENDLVMQLGVGGGLAYLVIQLVLEFLEKREKAKDKAGMDPALVAYNAALADLFKILKESRTMIKDLHEWHNHDDPSNPGSKIWYGTETARRIETIESDVSTILKSCGIKGRKSGD